MKKSGKKQGLLVSLLLLFTLVLTACGSTKTESTTSTTTTTTPASSTETAASSTSAATSNEASSKKAASSDVDLSKVTLRFGDSGWKQQEALLKAAGLDDTEYKVEYTTFQGGNLSLEAMASGQIDIAGSSEIPPIYASLAQNGGNFKIVVVKNSNTQLQELIIPKGSTMKSVADLKGKKVGYIKSTTAQYFLYVMLKDAGLKWTDIDAVEITTADGVTALLGGQLDAFASYGNSINAAKNNGATTLQSAENILSGNFPYEASVDALKDPAKRAAIADYLARLELANEWVSNNVEEWAKISADPGGLSVEDNLAILKKGLEQRSTTIQTISDAAIKSEQSVADAFFEVGLLEKKVDVTSFYDDSLTKDYEAALAELKQKSGK